MAYTNLQIGQRSAMFFQLITSTFIVFSLLVKLIQKKIDLRQNKQIQQPPSQSAAQKYKQQQITQHQFEQAAIKQTVLADQDSCVMRFVKKIVELNVNFGPYFLVFPLLFIIGRTYAWSIVLNVFGMLFCILFNMFKIHRGCIEHPLGRVLLQILFPITIILAYVLIFVQKPSSMLYLIQKK